MTTSTLATASAAQIGPSSVVNLGQAPTKRTYTLTVTGPAGTVVSAAANVQAGNDGSNFPYANQLLAQGTGSATAELVSHTPEQYHQGWIPTLSPGASATLTMVS